VSDEILAERRGAVLWITFNRPQARNAMKLSMYDRLVELCAEINASDSLRAVVLTGAGDKAFVSGTDIAEFEDVRSADDALSVEVTLSSSRPLRRVIASVTCAMNCLLYTTDAADETPG